MTGTGDAVSTRLGKMENVSRYRIISCACSSGVLSQWKHGSYRMATSATRAEDALRNNSR